MDSGQREDGGGGSQEHARESEMEPFSDIVLSVGSSYRSQQGRSLMMVVRRAYSIVPCPSRR